jgi:Ca-activated chloride channel homolog
MACLESPASHAQQPDQESPPALRATTELVKIDVAVQDKHGNFRAGLEQGDFRVSEDGKDQRIVFFAPTEAPAHVLVMVETSPAVYLIHEQHLSAVYALLDGLAEDDQVALVAYDRAPRPILGFTSEKASLAAVLPQIQYTIGMGDLNFYDSISTVLGWLAPLQGKKAVVLLTTGLDSSPPERWNALVQKLRGDDAVIFPVALGGSLRQPGNKKKKTPKTAPAPEAEGDTGASDSTNPLSFAKADEGLTSMARITGGRVYFPQSADDFAAIYREIAAGLRHQYVLGIVPEHDGRFHPLAVEVLGSSSRPSTSKAKGVEYKVFAREGYLAPAP